MNEYTKLTKLRLWLLLAVSISPAGCGDTTPSFGRDDDAGQAGDTEYPKDVTVPVDVMDMPNVAGSCDLIYPVLGCPCVPTFEPCCVSHERGLDPWRWRFGYQCGQDFQPDSERVWEIHVYPDADDPCGPGFCDPASYHRCAPCPPFWPYYDGVNYSGGPSQDDCSTNPRADGCPCGLEDHCCVMDDSTPSEAIGIWLCTTAEYQRIAIRSYLWLWASDFNCSNPIDAWRCTDCAPCDPSVEPPAAESL